jgi:hypothetical protein
MARFEFDQQPETRCGPGWLNSLVCDQNRRSFFHGYTPEGGEVTELCSHFTALGRAPWLAEGRMVC